MSALSLPTTNHPPEQQAIHDKCFHPAGTFIEFKREEVEQSIPDRFEQQVLRYPGRLAVKAGSQELSYDALNRAANRIARAILARRGDSEEPVALLLEKGTSLFAGILGVLKARKMYMPLDPSYPLSRNSYILEDSQAELVITNQMNLSLARELAQNTCQLINIDDIDSSTSTENLNIPIPPDSPAYIIYTSGSTGQPKGVFHSHRNLLYLIHIYTNCIHVCPQDRLTLLVPLNFSMAVTDTFAPLLNGAALFPLDIEGGKLANLAHWLGQEEITVYRSVPTVFRHFVGTLTGAEEFPKVRVICVSGEPVTKNDIELYKAHFSQQCIFVNNLGSAEAPRSRIYLVDHQIQIPGSTVPAGYEVAEIKVLLLDDQGKEVGFNQIGEIALKSPHLALGYWRKPDLTQAMFLPDTKGGDQRIYLTGDLGCMLSDGCLVTQGRKDFQVKIRGYRVEVVEIESALLNLDSVRDAAVVARETPLGNQGLLAYIVPAQRSAPTIGELRNLLEQKLPDYMVPSAFVFLDALPTLPNGKLDRQALPAPDKDRPSLESPFVAPRTPLEETLASIWAETLDLDDVGVHDDFLELGGNSLLAGLVISRVISTFRVELQLRTLFEAATVADMAVAIVQIQARQADPEDIGRMLADLEALSEEGA